MPDAMGAGVMQQPNKGTGNNPLLDQYKLYNTAVQQQAGDYDSIMGGYRNLLSKMQSGGTYNPAMAQYQPTADRTKSIFGLSELAQTGGYDEAGKADIRERGISPIRSVYANAQQNINRNRALQGGYSPNYNAATSRMAREMSDKIGNQVTNVNAGIAQNVAQNRISAAPAYAHAAGAESDLINQIGMRNADTKNEAARFNMRDMPQMQSEALRGMSGLYGTTPAMSSLFGNQALQGAQLQNQINQQGNQGNMQLIAQLIQSMGRR